GGIDMSGSLVYIAGGGSGLYIVNVNNPLLPQVIATYDTPGSAKAVSVANGYAYVADFSSLQIIEIGNHPATPTLKGQLSMSSASGTTGRGNHAYVLDGPNLRDVDVSNPAAPKVLSTTTNYGGQSLEVAGNLLFLTIPSPNFTPKGTINVLSLPASGPPSFL